MSERIIDTNLSGSDLTGANLTGASLQNSNLSGADLTDADLADTVLLNASPDSTTTWPDGFDPVPAGVTLN